MLFWYCEPFKTRPVSGFLSASPSSLLFGWFRRRRVLFFFPQALGKPKPLWFGFPFVFSSSCTRTSTMTRTSSSSPTPRPRPAPVFLVFFFRRRRSFPGSGVFLVRLSGGGWSWLAVVVLGLFFFSLSLSLSISLSLSMVRLPLSLSLSLSLSMVRLRGEHECSDQTERGGGLSDGAPAYYRHYCFWGLSTKRCPGRSVLNRLCSPHLLRSPLKQGPEEEVGEQAVLSHKCCFGLADRTVMQMFAGSALS